MGWKRPAAGLRAHLKPSLPQAQIKTFTAETRRTQRGRREEVDLSLRPLRALRASAVSACFYLKPVHAAKKNLTSAIAKAKINP